MSPSILSRLVLLPLLAGTAAAGLGSLCIWDSDTLADEVRGLPQGQDLVTGRWSRHGKAIEINPKAHFGRERFQIDLIRYVAACKKDRRLWTEHNYFTYNNRQPKGQSFHSIIGFT